MYRDNLVGTGHHPEYPPSTCPTKVHHHYSVQTHAASLFTHVRKQLMTYPNTSLGWVWDFLGCPSNFSDKLSGPRIPYPGGMSGDHSGQFSSTYKCTTMMIPSIKMVITRVDELLVMFQSQWVDQNRVIKKLFTKKPNSCQIHADLWQAKFMPNSCQKLAKFMPNVCRSVARLVRVHWWCRVRPFLNQCIAKW